MNVRKVHHSVFRPVSLERMMAEGLSNAMRKWKRIMPVDFSRIPPEEAASLLQFFKSVLRVGKFIHMSDGTSSCRFQSHWNDLNIAIRDRVAVDIARSVLDEVQEAAYKSWTAKVAEYERSIGGIGVAAAAGGVAAALHCSVQ